MGEDVRPPLRLCIFFLVFVVTLVFASFVFTAIIVVIFAVVPDCKWLQLVIARSFFVARLSYGVELELEFGVELVAVDAVA
jgi:hypothetical protein